MMICKADFEELFPEIFAPESRNGPKTTALQPNAECLVRWEDGGGRLDAVLAPCATGRQLSSRVASLWSGPMANITHWPMAPRLVALAAVWSGLGLSAPDRRKRFRCL